MRIGALIRLARPHFLLGGVLLFALGAFAAGPLDPIGYAVGQAMVTATQLTAHFANEFADAAADRGVTNRTWFSGGSGVLPGGGLAREIARRGAIGSSLLAVTAIAAMSTRSLPAAAIGVGALAIAWWYSVEPVRLLGTGFGELATSVVVAGGVPIAGALSVSAGIPIGLWWSVGGLIPVHIAMMLCFELPDLESDRRADKRVLAVRLGRRRATTTAFTLFGLGGAVLAAGITTEVLPAKAAVAFAAVVPAGFVAAGIRGGHWGTVTLGAVATLVVTTGGLLAALV